MYPTYALEILRRATTLPQLRDAAEQVGLKEALQQPLTALVEDSATPKEVARLLRTLMLLGAKTLADLGAEGRMQSFVGSNGRATRDRLVSAVRRQLEKTLEEVPTPAPSKPPPATPAPDKRPRSAAELQQWAAQHGALDVVGQPVHAFRARFPDHLSYGLEALWTFTLGQVVYADPRVLKGLGYVFHQTQAERFIAFAWELLQEVAQERRVQQEEARARDAALPALPEDPTLRRLLPALQMERDRLRKLFGIPDLLKDAKVSWDPSKRMVTYSSGSELDRPMVLSLEDWESGLFPCHHRGENLRPEAQCEHAPQVLDALMRALWLEPQSPLAQAIVQSLRQPAWARRLEDLRGVHRSFAARHKPAEDMQLSWRVNLVATQVTLKPVLHTRTKRGGWTAGSVGRPAELLEKPGLLPLPSERRALQLLAGLDRFAKSASSMVLHALESLAGHPRVFREGEEKDAPYQVRTFQVGLSLVPGAQGAWQMVPALDGKPLDPLHLLTWAEGVSGQRLVRIPIVDVPNRVLGVACMTPELEELVRQLHTHKPTFPAEALPDVLGFTADLEAHVPVTLPEHLKGEARPDAQHTLVRLTPLEDVGLRVELRTRPLVGGPPQVPGEGAGELHGTVEGRRVFVTRDRAAELARARDWAATLHLPAEVEDPAFVFTLDRGEEALDLVARLQAQTDPHFSVEWAGDAWRITKAATTQELKVVVNRRRDWFGVEGKLEVDGEQVDLAVLLDALRHKRRYVPVSGSRFVAIGQQLRERMQALAAGTFGGEKGVTLGPAAALALEALAPELGGLEGDGSFSAFLERVRAARAVEPKVPKHLESVLRDYQKDGYRWLVRLAAWGAGAVLADDMGLGKTLQALALLGERASEGPALVVAPTSVCRNWVDEAARFAPKLRLRLYRELEDATRDAAVAGLGPKDVLVVSYGLLTRDVERLASRTWGTLVVDEAQAVKNASTRRAAAARKLDAGFKVALTGTPLENHLGELWSIFRVVFPGLLGSWEDFRDRFAGPIERTGDAERRQALVTLCRPFLLRRTKAQVAPELPPRTDITLQVEPSAAEQRLYEQARLAAVARLAGLGDVPDEKQRFEVLAALTRLRLCACHPRLYDPETQVPSAKLHQLMELVDELREEGHRTLVFSQFTSLLALVREELDQRNLAYLYLDGQTPAARRDELVRLFQAGQGGDVFLISLKAGGTGLNLTAASYVIHLDPWWNPAVEDQASDRAHRIGQDKPVTVVRLVTQGTVEQQILAMHQDKRTLVAGILDGAETAARLGTEDLLALIQQGFSGAGEDAGDEEAPAEKEPQPVLAKVLHFPVLAPVKALPPPAPAPLPVQEVAPEPEVEPPPPAAFSAVAEEPPPEPIKEVAPAPVKEVAPAPAPPPAPIKKVAPAPAGFPEWMGGSREAFRKHQQRFQKHLDREFAAGKFASAVPTKSYPRTLERFGDYVEATVSKGKSLPQAPAELVQHYMALLRAGKTSAPASEPTIAGPALKRLLVFLKLDKDGGKKRG